MEEIEVPIEKVQEDIHHEVERAAKGADSGHSHQNLWFSQVALTSALLAVFAAITALMSGHHVNEAMIEQIQASDLWGYYQAKGIKSAALSTKIDLLSALGKPVPDQDHKKVTEYKKQQEEIAEKAEEKELSSKKHLTCHVVFARAVTLFQVAIGIAAISVLTRRRRFWFLGVGFGIVGVAFLIQGLFFLK